VEHQLVERRQRGKAPEDAAETAALEPPLLEQVDERRPAGDVQGAHRGQHDDDVEDDDVATQRRHEASWRLVLDERRHEQANHHWHDVEADRLHAREELEDEVHEGHGPRHRAQGLVGADDGHTPGGGASQHKDGRLQRPASGDQPQPYAFQALVAREQSDEEHRERPAVEQEGDPEDDGGSLFHVSGLVSAATLAR